MPDSVGISVPKITINGAAVTGVKADALLDVRVVLETAAAAAATLRFHDPYFELLEGSFAKIGVKLQVAFPDAMGKDVIIFKGKIAAIAAEQGAGDQGAAGEAGMDGRAAVENRGGHAIDR